MKKIIVTGGAGFIGSALVRHLVANEAADVLVIDKMTYAANRANLAEAELTGHCRLAIADICEQQAMASLVADYQPDQILHLAAESHVDRVHRDKCHRNLQHARGGPGLLVGPSCRGYQGAFSFPACLDRRGLWLIGR